MGIIKVIKSDAIVNIEIGTGFLQKLQKVYFYMIQQLTPEQIEMYNKCAEGNLEFPDEIMDYVMTMTVLIKEIEEKANSLGLVTDQEIPDDTRFTQPGD